MVYNNTKINAAIQMRVHLDEEMKEKNIMPMIISISMIQAKT
jgi:hypothetical protein